MAKRFGKLAFLLLALGLALPAHAQLQAARWYFGDRAGLDFRGGAPVAVNDGALYAQIGCSSQADSLGNLLFYTNGETIWNRQHQPMVNGTGLPGNRLNTIQLTVRQPGSQTLFYVFTTTGQDATLGLYYSVVDLGKHGGLGAVVQSEALRSSGAAVQLVAVPHRNQRDAWLIVRDQNADQFFAYLLTSAGLNATPVISPDGFRHNTAFAEGFGQLKASPDGRHLASAAFNAVGYSGGLLELLDFDAATGRIVNPVVLPSLSNSARLGVEFSPDGTKVYTAEPASGAIYQYDLGAPNVAASVTALPTPPGTGATRRGAALQLGPDGRIYVTLEGEARLGVIPEPNQKAPACGYSDEGVALTGRSTAALPTFLQRDLWRFGVRGTCQGEALAFDFPTSYGVDSVRWDFGDLGSGPGNHSTQLSPTHTYAAPGQYAVTLTLLFGKNHRQVLRQTVDVRPRPTANLGRDTTLCAGTALRLNIAQPGATYRWQNGSTAPSFTVTTAGTYWVDMTNSGGCITRDSLRVSVAALPQVKLGPDTVLCAGERLVLRSRLVVPGSRYRWSDGSIQETLTVTQPGTYWLEAISTAGCGSQRDSINVAYLTPSALNLGPDTAVCQQTPLVLNATLPGDVRYRWSDGSTAPTLTPTRSGTYAVTVYTPRCSVSDTIRVRLYDCREQLFVPNIITPNGDGLNDRLEIVGLGAASELTVYNRWGRQVYHAQPYHQDWDAAGLAAGVYYYQLVEPGGRRMRGYVQVVR
ncbi:T9SS type B sorting domain-containing protein [Hymenobacter cavernae]|uniref:PKD domain-containing protein n=1 Tax=Hymenobacter cavernae TaxID=2044852 RepID=A0ABQ1TZZ8_9BACT|nr:gliding motility-associated C-terminal domain-containing protein [Hymenobacter cavernae]GGF05332.1 hypothetical protein GCM10011383_15600 [Hymenobacter cavernae]